MNHTLLFLLIIVWFALGYAAAAALYANFHLEYPNQKRNALRKDLALYVMLYMLGAASLVSVFFESGFFQYGFKWNWPNVMKAGQERSTQ